MKDRKRLVMLVVAAFLLGVQTALHFVGRPLTGLPVLAVPLLALALALTGKRANRVNPYWAALAAGVF